MNEQTLTRYLLGALPETEQEKIDEQIFADDELFQQIRALKTELTDQYVRGNLTATERKNYETRFLTSPAGRNDAIFAKALTRLLGEENPIHERVSASAAKPSWWESFTALFRVPAFGLAMAALFVIVMGGVWWLQRQPIKPQQAKTAGEPETRQKGQDEIARTTSGSDVPTASAPPSVANPALKNSAPTTTPAPKNTASKTPNTMLSILLVPSMVRGDNPRTRISLPASTGRVQIQLDLDQSEKYLNYQAELRTKRGQLIQRQSRLVPRSTVAGKAVFFVAPATRLRDGDYDITLFGVTATGTVEEANFYQFTAVRR